MDNEGVPTFIAVIVAAVMVIGVMAGLTAVTWLMLFAANA
jgi:hypothetical protein